MLTTDYGDITKTAWLNIFFTSTLCNILKAIKKTRMNSGVDNAETHEWKTYIAFSKPFLDYRLVSHKAFCQLVVDKRFDWTRQIILIRDYTLDYLNEIRIDFDHQKTQFLTQVCGVCYISLTLFAFRIDYTGLERGAVITSPKLA